QTPHSDTQTFLRFEITDNGCGMSQEMKSRIFTAFEQETATTAQKYGGSGLGMSITKNLVDLMHGAITVESEKGVGTTFTVDLPFGIPEHRQEYTGKNFSDIKALVVDDDGETCEYTSIVLDRLKVKHDCATSGEEALGKIRKGYDGGKGYDLCFIDWRMPEMDGIALTKKIRAEFDDDTIIIIVSAYDLSEVEDEAKEAGVNMFVTKPVFQSTVFNMLMSLSGGKYIEGNKTGENYNFKGHRVLLVEDNALNMEIATELLSVTGIEVDSAENGKLALEKFTASPEGTYDIILMDIQMPIMDGHESTRAIRASEHPQAKTIPIYAMTANAFTEDISLALSAGMNGHIAKPIDTEIMYGVIEKVLRDK
ncbi:MAG: response regulator, partial [Oscillospiraceae bacterium]